jgi:cytochrome c
MPYSTLSGYRPFLLLLFCFAVSFQSCFQNDAPARVLVFSKTEGFRHDCIPTAMAALRKLGKENGMMVDSTEDAADFNEKNLKRYNAVVFLCTTGDVLNPQQESAFERYIQAGGGYVGMHSATDTEYGWKWYGGLSGAYFDSHPAQQEVNIQIIDHNHPSTKHLQGDVWRRKDELYNLKQVNPNLHILLAYDETSYTGGNMCTTATKTAVNPPSNPKYPCHPIAWYHDYDGGRAFYTGLGHTKESYSDPVFLQHLLGGLQYAVGNKKRLQYNLCRTPEMPDPTRFVKTVLASDLTEPMQFAMLPDGKVMVIERRGLIKLLDPTTGNLFVVHKLPVHSDHEDGLIGLALDPNYEKNHWIYLYYSDPGAEPYNNLSRFVFTGDTLDRKSEKLLLRVTVQRKECCHAGGCIQFDRDGQLYLSTGDNSNPFASEGYDPIDERPGRSPWDAQRSSANSMDLRGKILRIKPQDDGTYICPAGNLFTEKDERIANQDIRTTYRENRPGRPEIYVMGCRNPFRISVDSRRHMLFWGEVGPDAGEPDTTRGPAGHDEVNRARQAGFFGWPYFVGNNKPYRKYDFAAKKYGGWFDPKHPVNNSPNNTGTRDLPPAQPALVWYPYGNSPEFPLVGSGGRCAMAGPVYYCDQYPADTRMPDYFNGKLIAYEWMRNWMMAISLDSVGDFSRMEPLADSIRLSRPMDMFVDKNGSIWVLEYGTQWFASNADARISRIDYVRGNRPPIPSLEVSKTAGASPLNAVFSVAKSKDYDHDKMLYELDYGDGNYQWSADGRFWWTDGKQSGSGGSWASQDVSGHVRPDTVVHVYSKPGNYEVTLTVVDEAGSYKSLKQKITVGNEPPLVHWDLGKHNRSFYKPGDTLHYSIVVEDQEDGSLDNGAIAPGSVATSIDYLETGFDITAIAQGHQSAMQQAEYARGKILIDKSDCKTCHAVDHQVNGPAFQAVAARYRNDPFAVRTLTAKVIKGGAGNWGQTVMSAHPQVSEEDVSEMVRWVLTLGDPPKAKQAMPVKGDYVLSIPPPKDPKKKVAPGVYLLQASYKDRGSISQQSLNGSETVALRPAFQQAEKADSTSREIRQYRPGNGDTVLLIDVKHRSFFLFKHTDLNHVHSVSIGLSSADHLYPQAGGGRIELHLDSPKGPMVGSVAVPKITMTSKIAYFDVQVPVQWKPDGKYHDLYFVVRNENNPSQAVAAVDWVRFEM